MGNLECREGIVSCHFWLKSVTFVLGGTILSIKGIANAAALSGANSNEASRAMYNFAQALSAGHVKLIDWKSIENANMATVEFKQQLLDSAVAAGTVPAP